MLISYRSRTAHPSKSVLRDDVSRPQKQGLGSKRPITPAYACRRDAFAVPHQPSHIGGGRSELLWPVAGLRFLPGHHRDHYHKIYTTYVLSPEPHQKIRNSAAELKASLLV